MKEKIASPNCGSTQIKKNGHIHNGRQNHLCKSCGRQFVNGSRQKRITDEQKKRIRRLLRERISLRGICRVMEVSLMWLLEYFVKIAGDVPSDMGIMKPKKSEIAIEIDEMQSFVGNKSDKVWIWIAIDRASGKIVGFHIGGRRRDDALKLWESLPGVYRQCAVCYTDFWESYKTVLPTCRHRAVGKETGLTNHIERTDCTLRQRVSRLVRKHYLFLK